MNYLIRQLDAQEIPRQLSEIPQPPKTLWCAGTPPQNDDILLTVVGSRKYTAYGKQVCEKLIAGLRGYPVTIVSGLALGIDAIAHEAALRAGLRTIAVPGSGLDPGVIYPRSHHVLASRIVEAGGALLSEYEPMFKATEWSFPQRNRIMAGLAKAVLVVEAGNKSGTLITSRLATEYNRDVLTVPGSIFSENSDGPNMLLKLGATPITSSEDVLLALGISLNETLLSIDNYSELPPLEQNVLTYLNEPKHKEDVIAHLGLPANEANILFMRMEIAEYIIESDGFLRRS